MAPAPRYSVGAEGPVVFANAGKERYTSLVLIIGHVHELSPRVDFTFGGEPSHPFYLVSLDSFRASMQNKYPDELAQPDESFDGYMNYRLCHECIVRREEGSPLSKVHTERMKTFIASDDFSIDCLDMGPEELKFHKPIVVGHNSQCRAV